LLTTFIITLNELINLGYNIKHIFSKITQMVKYFYVVLTISLTVYGQIIIKSRASYYSESDKFLIKMFFDLWVFSGLISALAASVAWMLAVKDSKLSLIYPFMALTFIIIPLLAVQLFGEKINSTQFIGLFLILIGISLSSKTV
jgi:multidrug transporter EmrE-like cation transporter